jgi:uncharacterized protein (TIGR02597 family)
LRTRKTTLNPQAMKTTALRFRTLALGLAMSGSIAASLEAIDAFTDPVGYYTLSIQGASDNVMSLPMVRDAVFSGVVDNGVNAFTANGFDALAGTASPAWTANQWAYAQGTQSQTYYVEFTSGALKGLYYKITANGAGSITLDTEGDSLLNHPLPGNLTAALADGDSFKIRSYWRVKDVLQNGAVPVIDAWPDADTVRDEVLFLNYTAVGQNKAPNLSIHFDTTLGGWRAFGDDVQDYGDFTFRPNEAFIIRRRNVAAVNLTNLGGVLMNSSISFVPGGNGTKGNDIYISIARPAAVSLDQSGLRLADQTKSLIKDSPNPDSIEDQLLAFGSGTGFNRAPNATYYYLAGAGWRMFPDDVTNVGATAMLEPGKSYIIRKKANSVGRDWVNPANY